MKKLLIVLGLMFGFVVGWFVLTANAETWIEDYGYYENSNEISAKDRLIGSVDNIFDFENGKNAGGESIENGRYYIETKYKGGYNGTDPDYIYIDEFIGKDGIDGVDGVDGKDGTNGVDGQDGEKGDKGNKGDTGAKGVKGDKGKQGIQGIQGEQGRGLEDRYEVMIEGRLLDTKKTTWSVYAGHDFNNDVNIIGAKCTIKFGTSYEERRLNELEKKISTLTKEQEYNSVEVVPYGKRGLKIKTNF